MTGGEVAAMAIVEAVVRLLPGVLGNAESIVEESFAGHGLLLEYPQYTRPLDFRGQQVPEVLRSGNHAHIKAYRTAEAEARTALRRPDLFARYEAQKPVPPPKKSRKKRAP
jgi:tRNA (guanine37-N1)-methyltransferase